MVASFEPYALIGNNVRQTFPDVLLKPLIQPFCSTLPAWSQEEHSQQFLLPGVLA
jgi:hypothetical protein